jgi:ABC-type uncharacterized transport system involved in gliding motility auxiliary subunit
MTEDRKKAGRSIWRHRGRRFATGLNVFVSVLLAMVATALINHLVGRYGVQHWDWSSDTYYKLSDKTLSLMESLDAEVHIVAFYQRKHIMFDELSRLLKEYEYANAKLAKPQLKIRLIDTDRDLAEARELARRYDVKNENVIVVESGERRKYLDNAELADYQSMLDGRVVTKRRVTFNGEVAISSAIQSVVQSVRPVVYFLTGHGERNIKDTSEQAGYSKLAVQMRRDNIDVKPLVLADQTSVPDDCSLLIIAGPDRKLPQAEVSALAAYLNKSGRVLFMLDPVVSTGLEKLLEEWGVKLEADVVVNPASLAERYLCVTQYGAHPVTQNLKGLITMFYMPRSVEPLVLNPQEPVPADKPRVSVLAYTREGWAEMNPNENPPRFHQGIDRPGPVSVAVAVERGPQGGIKVEFKPTRIVVIGDSFFVSNAAREEVGGGNEDFLFSCINWLVEREALMAIAPKKPGELQLGVDPSQENLIWLLIVATIPSVIALLGFAVRLGRR